MYGREEAGTSWIAVIQATDATTDATSSAAVSRIRRRSRPDAQNSVPTASAGRMNHACAIFAWNPTPMKTPARSRGHSLALIMARCQNSRATARLMASRPSSIGCPNIDTRMGVEAAAGPATSPAPGPPHRSPISEQAHTVTSPSIT